MVKNILLAGGSGLVGKQLTSLLKYKGYNVAWLSRQAKPQPEVLTFLWNVKDNTIDEKAIDFADAIINLSGAGVADKRWTNNYKKEIYDSRIQSTRLLADCIKRRPDKIKVFVNASAIGIYGNTWDEAALETTEPGNTFLAKVCIDWESEALKANESVVRTVIVRTGIVLSENAGFVGELKAPVRLYAGTAMGSGNQLISWIHLKDLCNIYIAAIENERMKGAYNAVATVPVTNKQLTYLLAHALNRKIILPNIPGFVLKIVLGEMADMLVGNQPVSGRKILDTGFKFEFAQAQEALNDLLH